MSLQDVWLGISMMLRDIVGRPSSAQWASLQRLGKEMDGLMETSDARGASLDENLTAVLQVLREHGKNHAGARRLIRELESRVNYSFRQLDNANERMSKIENRLAVLEP